MPSALAYGAQAQQRHPGQLAAGVRRRPEEDRQLTPVPTEKQRRQAERRRLERQLQRRREREARRRRRNARGLDRRHHRGHRRDRRLHHRHQQRQHQAGRGQEEPEHDGLGAVEFRRAEGRRRTPAGGPRAARPRRRPRSRPPPSRPAPAPRGSRSPPPRHVELHARPGRGPVRGRELRLAGQQKYFDATPCHRLTSGALSVLQCGDPTGTGSGGPGYSFADELTGKEKYTRGVLAMANSGPNTNGSQFFIVYKDSTLPASYTVFGTGQLGSRRRRQGGGQGVDAHRRRQAQAADLDHQGDRRQVTRPAGRRVSGPNGPGTPRRRPARCGSPAAGARGVATRPSRR